MKNSAISLFLLVSLTVSAQYKHFSVGIHGTANDFDSHKFYSSPGASFQYNFKRVFTVCSAVSQEKMKRSSMTYNDLNGDYAFGNLALTYLNIPVSVRASFGKKVLIYTEAGAAFHLKYNIHNEGYVQDNFDNPGEATYYSYDYSPNSARRVMFFCGAGALIPITKGINIELGASRSFYRPEDSNENFIFINETFHSTRGFVQFKYSLGLSYTFNLKKDSNYKFSTLYLGVEKNVPNEN